MKKMSSTALENVRQLARDGVALPLMEAFYTIQGEGCHKGTAAYFVRIGGCDVGCHWCDVKESWDAARHPVTPTLEIAETALRFSKVVVVTGGEPLTWNMAPLTTALKERGAQTHIETSGAYPLSGQWDWFCLSPKKRMAPKPECYARADELKVIVHNRDDLNYAQAQAARVSDRCLLYLQPEWSVREKMIPRLVDFVMANPQWKVSLQTHKYMNIP